jgi:hypothetical protein
MHFFVHRPQQGGDCRPVAPVVLADRSDGPGVLVVVAADGHCVANVQPAQGGDGFYSTGPEWNPRPFRRRRPVWPRLA